MLSRHKLDLVFQSPDVALREAALVRCADPKKFVVSSKYKKDREKWCIAKFGLGYSFHIRPCLVAINNSTHRLDADAFVRVDEQEFAFQIVESQDPDRKRGDEYKAFASGEIKTVAYDPERGRIEGPGWIAEKVEQKVAKYYAGSGTLHLLVYENIRADQLEYEDVRAALACFRGKFASIWIITTSHIATAYGCNDLGSILGWGKIPTSTD